jgi:nucleotide-binding universal stress UspA family protein
LARTTPTSASENPFGASADISSVSVTFAPWVRCNSITTAFMVSVEEIDHVPEQIEEVREEAGAAARRFHSVVLCARKMAEDAQVKLHTHVVAGHPVRTIVNLAAELNAELLVIGARGHSALYERLVGSRADRIMQLAHCPVLVVK